MPQKIKLSDEQKKTVELTVSDGKLDCSKTSLGTYVCINVNPIKNISGVCVDDQTSVATVDQVEVNPVNFSTDDWITIS